MAPQCRLAIGLLLCLPEVTRLMAAINPLILCFSGLFAE